MGNLKHIIDSLGAAKVADLCGLSVRAVTNGAHQILYQELNIQVKPDIPRFYLKPWAVLSLRKKFDTLANLLSQALRLSHDCNLPTPTEKKTIKTRQKLWQ